MNLQRLLQRYGTPSCWRFLTTAIDRVSYDVCIVGGGPAGLSAAIRTKQLAEEAQKEVKVCVLDKGVAIGKVRFVLFDASMGCRSGSHILSGCVMDPRALNELLPGWNEKEDLPYLMTKANTDRMHFLTDRQSFRLPIPPQLKNKDCFIVSLGAVCRWLAEKAEALGVDIFPGFAASHIIRDAHGAVGGVRTKDRGVARDGQRKPNFEPGIEIEAKVTLLAEGCRGSISQDVMNQFHLREESEHQTYGLGIKEVWEVSEAKHKEGEVIHTIGYPLPSSVYGGGFLYHMADRKVALGLVVGLDYENPYISVFNEFQKFKMHPLIRNVIENGRCLQYGARALNEGGLQSLPKLNFPGGALIGCSAGFMNSLRLKGTHGAIKSGILAAETFMAELKMEKQGPITMDDYPQRFRNSWLYDELYSVRNVRPMFRNGLYIGLFSAFLHAVIFRGSEPWTFKYRKEDSETLRHAKDFRPIHYPIPDNKTTFDVTSSLFNSETNHDHDQPIHLQIRNPDILDRVNLPIFAKPETRYCPASVYEYLETTEGRPKLQIHSQNCLHCKACDIKDPMKNIKWTVPEGGDGPAYTIM